jgi:hypothetical protein
LFQFSRSKHWLAILVLAFSSRAIAQIAILQIQITEGEGAVHIPGSRTSRPLTVVVTDETGRPVEGAAVSFHLPDDGPGGLFLSGLRTEVTTTDARGRAVVRAIQANRTPGRFQLRIIAAKEQARAGTVSFQYIADTPQSSPQSAKAGASSSRGKKWAAAIVALAAGGVAAGVFASRSGSTPTAVITTPTLPPALSVGNPSITVGHP